MDLWWDADRVVFGYAKAKNDRPVKGFPGRLGHQSRLDEEPTHLFQIGIDGKNLRQLTDHRLWSDLDPAYLPNGGVAFASERCGASLQCNEMDKDETSCNLYAMRPDGGAIRWLSVTKDGDYLPHCLDDGTIGYTRWEYEQRGWAHVQSLWTVRPDGTGADARFKQHLNEPWALEDFRSIPGQILAQGEGDSPVFAETKTGTVPAVFAETKTGTVPYQQYAPGAGATARVNLVAASQAAQKTPELEDGDVVYVAKRSVKPIYVSGLVRKPGEFPFPINQDIRLLDAIALAGGCQNPAADKVLVIRQPPGQDQPIRIEASIQSAKSGGDNLQLGPGDAVLVEHTPLSAVVEAVQSLFRVGLGASVSVF
jgi:hypothetical protein